MTAQTVPVVAEVELVESDAATYPFDAGTFDVVISRNGLMFFATPTPRSPTLARALRPTGRIAFTAPQGLDRNPWIMVAGAAAVPHIGMPASVTPGQPGPLGLADKARIEDVLTRAGFEVDRDHRRDRVDAASGPTSRTLSGFITLDPVRPRTTRGSATDQAGGRHRRRRAGTDALRELRWRRYPRQRCLARHRRR